MSNGVEKYEPPQIADIDQWAEKLYASGMFSDVQSVAQAAVKIAAGAEMGLTPFQSMSGVHLIKNKVVIGAGLLASVIDRDPAYDYSVEWEPDDATPVACTVTVLKNGKLRGSSRFSIDDAKTAGIYRDQWLKYPKAMLFARAMSQGVRWYAPGATGGSVYVEGELTADVEVEIPEGVTAKPRTRVTAEVIPTEDVELDYEPVTLPSVGQQLKTMGAMERKDLYRLCNVTSKPTPEEANAIFIAKADELNLPFHDPPSIHAILSRLRIVERDNLPSDAVSEFDRFAQTGESLEDGDQATLDAEALA